MNEMDCETADMYKRTTVPFTMNMLIATLPSITGNGTAECEAFDFVIGEGISYYVKAVGTTALEYPFEPIADETVEVNINLGETCGFQPTKTHNRLLIYE
jgi:hypothetical protein